MFETPYPTALRRSKKEGPSTSTSIQILKVENDFETPELFYMYYILVIVMRHMCKDF